MPTETKELERSWLVQRFAKSFNKERPPAQSIKEHIKENSFDKHAYGEFCNAVSFDYMGAAEFEYGAIPECIKNIVHMELESFSFTVHREGDEECEESGEHSIYVIGEKGLEAEIEERIKFLIENDGRHSGPGSLKEHLSFSRAFSDSQWKPVGWMEMDNGFFFFVDKDVCDYVATLMGL